MILVRTAGTSSRASMRAATAIGGDPRARNSDTAFRIECSVRIRSVQIIIDGCSVAPAGGERKRPTYDRIVVTVHTGQRQAEILTPCPWS